MKLSLKQLLLLFIPFAFVSFVIANNMSNGIGNLLWQVVVSYIHSFGWMFGFNPLEPFWTYQCDPKYGVIGLANFLSVCLGLILGALTQIAIFINLNEAFWKYWKEWRVR